MSDKKKTILAIIGSASSNSSSFALVKNIADLASGEFNFNIYEDLKTLPHFDPELSASNPPEQIIFFRKSIEQVDGIIICTPEYVFSIPSGLKNAIEWCIATTAFLNKPCGLITASTDGEKAHEELQLIMTTTMAKLSDETNLLIQGVKSKLDSQGNLTDDNIKNQLRRFIDALIRLMKQ
jgi:chromate reductase, NAD(P)H dehydrogenase (quinone)